MSPRRLVNCGTTTSRCHLRRVLRCHMRVQQRRASREARGRDARGQPQQMSRHHSLARDAAKGSRIWRVNTSPDTATPRHTSVVFLSSRKTGWVASAGSLLYLLFPVCVGCGEPQASKATSGEVFTRQLQPQLPTNTHRSNGCAKNHHHMEVAPAPPAFRPAPVHRPAPKGRVHTRKAPPRPQQSKVRALARSRVSVVRHPPPNAALQR